MNKNNKKGFTLAELLIVVAIIGILVAIAIPVFTAQLEKARVASDVANARSLYAQLQADAMTEGSVGTVEWSGNVATYNGNSYKFNYSGDDGVKVESSQITYNHSSTSTSEAWTFGVMS